MHDSTERYLFPADGPEVEPLEKALNLMLRLCRESGKPLRVALFVPVKDNVRGTTLAAVLGDELAERLRQDEVVTLPNGGIMQLQTMRTFKCWEPWDVVVAVYADEKMLDVVDGLTGVSAVIVVPWRQDDVRVWAQTWNPGVPEESKTSTEGLTLSPVVEESLRWLGNFINMNNLLATDMDRTAAIQVLETLHMVGEVYDPDSLKAWVVQQGWPPEAANRLKKLARAILDGKSLRRDPTVYFDQERLRQVYEKGAVGGN